MSIGNTFGTNISDILKLIATFLLIGRAGVPMEVMGLMLGEFVDDYTVRVIDVFAMPQSGTVSAFRDQLHNSFVVGNVSRFPYDAVRWQSFFNQRKGFRILQVYYCTGKSSIHRRAFDKICTGGAMKLHSKKGPLIDLKWKLYISIQEAAPAYCVLTRLNPNCQDILYRLINIFT